jgi:hypothetical protein
MTASIADSGAGRRSDDWGEGRGNMKISLAAMTALGAALILPSGVPVAAHHAVHATVDINRTVDFKATLTRIDWVNPHTWMRFDITLPNGTIQKNVMVESLGIGALRQVGIDSKSALKLGEQYTISFYPNRDGTPGGFMTQMVLPDGRSFDARTFDPIAARPTQ